MRKCFPTSLWLKFLKTSKKNQCRIAAIQCQGKRKGYKRGVSTNSPATNLMNHALHALLAVQGQHALQANWVSGKRWKMENTLNNADFETVFKPAAFWHGSQVDKRAFNYNKMWVAHGKSSTVASRQRFNRRGKVLFRLAKNLPRCKVSLIRMDLRLENTIVLW